MTQLRITQLELGGEGLDERGRYLLEINLDDLESSTGEDQHLWLLQIEAARHELQLRTQTENSNSQNTQERDRA